MLTCKRMLNPKLKTFIGKQQYLICSGNYLYFVFKDTYTCLSNTIRMKVPVDNGAIYLPSYISQNTRLNLTFVQQAHLLKELAFKIDLQ